MNPDSRRPKQAFTILVGIASLLVGGCVSEGVDRIDPAPVDRFSELDGYIRTTMRDWRVPGVAVAIVSSDGVAYAKGFGTLDVATHDPVTPETIFAVGSNGKSLTATMLGALEDEGALHLSDRIVTILPEFRMADPEHTDFVTLEDAMSHLSGLPAQSGLGAWYLQGADQKSLVESIGRVTPAAPLRTRFAYNNSMFAAAAEAAEFATGQSYHELMRTRIFAPLGMNRSSTSLDEFPDGNLAKPHAYIGGQPTRIAFHPVRGASAAGSVNASLLDMTRFVRMMLNNGTLDGTTVVSEKTARRIQSMRHELAEDEMPEIVQILKSVDHPEEVGRLGYGLGLATVQYFGATYSLHGGAIDGMTSWMMWSADADVGVVVLTNSGNIAYPAWASFAALNAAAGLPRDTTLERLAMLRDPLTADQPRPEPAMGVAALLPVADLAGTYENPLGGFSITNGKDGNAVLTFLKTGYGADVIALGGKDYWVDMANPALPDFGLTLTSDPNSDLLVLEETPSEYPALFASYPAFVRRDR